MTYNVMAIDNVDLLGLALLESHTAITLTAKGKPSRDEVLALIPDAHALIIRSGTTVDAEMLAKADNLKVVVRAGVGVDNVDLDAATAKGVVVMNVPSANTVSTAEHTFGLMLAVARHIPQGYASMLAGRWDRKWYMGVEMRGKTLGLVGLGRIGKEVAKRALAFEMTVVAYDPYITQEALGDLDVQLVALDALYAQADFISLHAAATEETKGMINAESIAKMKDGVRLVNAARGVLIQDADLAEAIKSGKVAGVALDVYAPEPPPSDHPLVGLDGVIHTPHLAANTFDAQAIVAVDSARQVINALVDGTFVNVVNPAVQRG